MLKLHLSYIELAIFRAQICLDIIDHGGAIFYPFSLVIVWNKRTTVGLSLCSYRPKKLPKIVATLHFYGRWEKRPKKIVGERKLLYETNELQFFLVYILIDHRNDQKWLQLSISMVDKREDLENCCREKVIVRNKPTTAFLSLYSYRPQKWPQYGHTFSFLWSITEQWWIQAAGPGVRTPSPPPPPIRPDACLRLKFLHR